VILLGTNTIAYLAFVSDIEKCFIALAPGVSQSLLTPILGGIDQSLAFLLGAEQTSYVVQLSVEVFFAPALGHRVLPDGVPGLLHPALGPVDIVLVLAMMLVNGLDLLEDVKSNVASDLGPMS
jgi:hypothetical protein